MFHAQAPARCCSCLHVQYPAGRHVLKRTVYLSCFAIFPKFALAGRLAQRHLSAGLESRNRPSRASRCGPHPTKELSKNLTLPIA